MSAVAVAGGSATAAVLDWDVETWPAGDLSRTFVGVGGGDVTITVTGDTAYLTDVGGNPTPQINGVTDGGTGEDSLLFRTDYPSGALDEITITIDLTHAGGVQGLSFTMFDLDMTANNWIDELQINATDGSSTFNPSSIVGGSCVSQTAADTVEGICNVNNNSPDGNVTLTFNQSGITQVTIVYRNIIPQSDPGAQRITLHDISFSEPRAIVKRAFQSDGTPIADGATLPSGTPVRFLLYVSNPGAAISDASIRDALDPLFAYSSGSMRFDASVASCAAVPCTAIEEAAIFAAADTGTIGTDLVDADVVSSSGSTLDAGNQSAANAQLDIPAGRVWAWLFTVVMQ